MGVFGKLIIPMFFGIFVSSCSIKNNSVKPYVESNLESIIIKQEERFGIKHFGKPNVSYGFPQSLEREIFAAAYSPKDDLIYLTREYTQTPELNFDNLLMKFSNIFGNLDNVYNSLNHELGHYYLDKLAESLGIGDWPIYEYCRHEDERIGLLLVSEGIAEYFERNITGIKIEDNFKDSDWPYLVGWFWRDYRRNFYDGGYHLVKPILDMHGKRGMEYLILNPPTLNDLLEMPQYQKKIIKEIDFKYS